MTLDASKVKPGDKITLRYDHMTKGLTLTAEPYTVAGHVLAVGVRLPGLPAPISLDSLLAAGWVLIGIQPGAAE